jgi:hypothetical protein
VSTEPADEDELIASLDQIGDGECRRSGTILRLINLNEEQREKLRQKCLNIISYGASEIEEQTGWK